MTGTSISEIIHKWTGWCPHGLAVKTKMTADVRSAVPAMNPVTKSPGPSGSDGSGIPGGRVYEHTQPGYLLAGTLGAACLFLLGTMLFLGPQLVTILVLCILVAVLAIMARLTVSVTPANLRIRFGPLGIIRKQWPVAEIVSATPVTNPWYYGYGIHYTPRGTLYNVSGRYAVEVLLFSGQAFRIGTDEPEALCLAIGQAGAEAQHTPAGRESP
ncbi:hypothetical protein [Methanoregula sp.]|uniref:hypothetical protein n=1 Tax=Methanoregula sp. TaxID=2052170 RepID=UPI003566F964